MINRFIYILWLLPLVIVSCQTKEEMDNVISGNDNIVLNFSIKDNPISKGEVAEEFDFESKITHLDIFIYEIKGTESSYSDALYYHTRLDIDSQEGTKQLPGLKLSDLKGNERSKKYKICAIANSTRPETDFKDENGTFNEEADTFGELSQLVEETQYINITGSTLFKDENGNNIAPQTFLMTGEAIITGSTATFGNYSNCTDLTSFNETDLNLSLVLERAAAKITFNFSIQNESQHIHSFGNPTSAALYTKNNTEYIDINTIDANSTYNYSHGSYYLRNMTYGASYFGGNSSLKRKTNPVPYTEGGYMSCTTSKVTITVYVYSCSWGGSQAAAFTDTPFLIVNLPMVEREGTIKATPTGGGNEKEITAGKYLERNYYEIPLRLRGDEDATASIQRNHHYVLNATIDAPGGITSMEPFPIVPVSYWVYPWNEYSIEVGTDAEGAQNAVKYLNLSTSSIEMRNTTTDSSIKFASSSDIESVTLSSGYYIDKNGDHITISGTGITAAASSGMNGNITVTSPVPTNNAASYLTFTVKNKDGLTKEFTVVQYPLLYIFNTVGWYSYREDVINTNGQICHYQNRQGSGNVTESNDGFSFRVYDRPNTLWGSSSNWGIYVYSDSGIAILTKDGWRHQFLGGLTGGDLTYELDNPRMYHVNVSATSKDYVLGKPLLDSDGTCVNDESNANMVSPSFMIASQLGTLNGDETFNEEAYNKAKNHCLNYVETYILNDDGNNIYDGGEEKVVHLDDWRLPTQKEIEIIASHQNTSPAMDELLEGQYYICITGTNTPYTNGKSNGWEGYYTRCVRDAYNSSTPTN